MQFIYLPKLNMICSMCSGQLQCIIRYSQTSGEEKECDAQSSKTTNDLPVM